MLVILKYIPQNIETETVEKFIEPLLKGKFWQKNGSLNSLRVIEITDLKNTFTEHHFIATISPDEVGTRIINKLDGQKTFGVVLDVKEYIVRNWRNERRMDSENMKKWISNHSCLRIIDRRRSGLIVQIPIVKKSINSKQSAG